MKKIIGGTCLIVLPMFASTITICWLVFANLVPSARCPYPALCPESSSLNSTRGPYYYVDYPAARLAFVSSWSSTISTSLISVMMTVFGFSVAKLFDYHSEQDDAVRRLPTPYQTSLLFRILNADFLCLWDMAYDKVRDVFWKQRNSTDTRGLPRSGMLRHSVLVLFLCISARYVVWPD